uniref:Uncharacterized protein n=2 Tax=unclassified Caudoviricetes TaxID=2788787 RepID=A0A8S5Q707_9CAUD|nr:MAG TPA: hypothetical protein [Siphoviridae sp. ctAvK3]DAE15150.1 MAG TPA: hypothetical protein [Siphoviridae sp. ctdVv30]
MTTISTATNSSTTAPVSVGLCASRHAMPVTEYIYPESVDPTDFERMDEIAEDFVLHHVGLTTVTRQALDQRWGEDVPCWAGKRTLIVYVTGLTAATAAVIKACALNGAGLTLMHYNRESGEYLPQQIF